MCPGSSFDTEIICLHKAISCLNGHLSINHHGLWKDDKCAYANFLKILYNKFSADENLKASESKKGASKCQNIWLIEEGNPIKISVSFQVKSRNEEPTWPTERESWLMGNVGPVFAVALHLLRSSQLLCDINVSCFFVIWLGSSNLVLALPRSYVWGLLQL